MRHHFTRYPIGTGYPIGSRTRRLPRAGTMRSELSHRRSLPELALPILPYCSSINVFGISWAYSMRNAQAQTPHNSCSDSYCRNSDSYCSDRYCTSQHNAYQHNEPGLFRSSSIPIVIVHLGRHSSDTARRKFSRRRKHLMMLSYVDDADTSF